MNSKEIARKAFMLLDEKKAQDIKVIDISKISVIADYFIITGGANERQVKALADNVEEKLGKEGIIPKFSSVSDGISWFKGRNQWQKPGYRPMPGDIIFFDWEGDGSCDHVGIVEKCDENTVYTIEGNSRDECRRKTYSINSMLIFGYGVPKY